MLGSCQVADCTLVQNVHLSHDKQTRTCEYYTPGINNVYKRLYYHAHYVVTVDMHMSLHPPGVS